MRNMSFTVIIIIYIHYPSNIKQKKRKTKAALIAKKMKKKKSLVQKIPSHILNFNYVNGNEAKRTIVHC